MIQENRLSSVLGYTLKKGLASQTSGWLPQRIAVVGQATTTKEATAPDTLSVITAAEAASAFGAGSPVHLAAIALANQGTLGDIETVIYKVDAEGSATAETQTISITGTASRNATQYIAINGISLSFTVLSGAEAATIAASIAAAVNAHYASPFTAAVATDDVVLTAKWKGDATEGLSLDFTQTTDAGLTYSAVKVAGAGASTPTAALEQFGSEWNTLVVNCLSTSSTVLDAYEAFVGNSTDGTGRYGDDDWKPCVVVSGTSESDKDTLETLTDGRLNEQANAILACGGSLSMGLEIAGAIVGVYALLANSDPKQDPLGKTLTGIVVGSSQGDLATSAGRDYILKNGCGTTKVNASKYEIVDFVTTYHPEGENPAQFRYVRNLIGIDFNVKFAVRFNENTYVIGRTILPDATLSTANGIIKPKIWKAILDDKVFKPFEEAGLFGTAGYAYETCTVSISDTNPDRLDTEFGYKRSGTARISDVVGVAEFTLGGTE